MTKKTFLLIFTFYIFLLISLSKAYSLNRGLSPEIALSYKLNDKYSFNGKIESFHFFEPSDETNLWNDFVLDGVDFQFFANRRINPFQSAALGYQYSYDPGGVGSNRLIQQYSFTTSPGSIRFSHRLRSDQTFHPEDPLRLRFRYRFAIQLPLQGEVIDPKEFYMVASDELIYSLQDSQNSYENRLVASLGYVLANENHRIQAGFDYRTRLRDNAVTETLWFEVAWLVRLN
jgi:hypothetical protein